MESEGTHELSAMYLFRLLKGIKSHQDKLSPLFKLFDY